MRATSSLISSLDIMCALTFLSPCRFPALPANLHFLCETTSNCKINGEASSPVAQIDKAFTPKCACFNVHQTAHDIQQNACIHCDDNRNMQAFDACDDKCQFMPTFAAKHARRDIHQNAPIRYTKHARPTYPSSKSACSIQKALIIRARH